MGLCNNPISTKRMEYKPYILLNIDEFSLTILPEKGIAIDEWEKYAEKIIDQFVRITQIEKIYDGKVTKMMTEKLEGYDVCYNLGIKDYYFAMAYHSIRADMGVCIKYSAKAWAIYQAKYKQLYDENIILPDLLQRINKAIKGVIRLTRIDMTVDYYNYEIDLNDMYEQLKNKSVLVQDDTGRCRIKRTSFQGEDEKIQTLYVGSKGKGTKGFLRIYNKKIEQIKNNGFRLNDAINCHDWIRYEAVYKGVYAHAITKELLKNDMDEQEFTCYIAKIITQKYRLFDLLTGEYRKETKDLLNIADGSNSGRLRCDSPRDNTLKQSIKYMIFSSGLFSLLYKIENLFGEEGIRVFEKYLWGCYTSNIWRSATMTRELNLWLKKHEELAKGCLEDNF